MSDHKFQVVIARPKHIFINQNRNHRIQYIFDCEEYVYFCCINIHEVLESIFCILLVVKVLSKCLKMFGHLGRGQVAVTDELTLHCPIHSMFGVLCHMQGCCHKEPGSCRHCSFCYSRSIFWAHFSDVMGVRKLWWIWLATDHQTVATVFCECKFGFGEWSGSASWSSHCPFSCYVLSTLLQMSVRGNDVLLGRMRDRDDPRWFLSPVSPWDARLQNHGSLASITSS